MVALADLEADFRFVQIEKRVIGMAQDTEVGFMQLHITSDLEWTPPEPPLPCSQESGSGH